MSGTISAKYQVVIPKDARRKMGLRPGQKIVFSDVKKDGSINLTRQPTAKEIIKKYAGSMSGAWGNEDPAVWLRKDRDLSDRGPNHDRSA